jgi:hypothetical protein
MSATAKSVLVFGIYLVGMGAGLLLQPNALLGPLGFPPTSEVWSRVVGLLALLLAFYYVQAARADLRPFFQWTVYTRVVIFLAFAALVAAGLAAPSLALLGAVDLAGAAWTAWALRRNHQPSLAV